MTARKRLAFVVATKDRPDDLRKLLGSLVAQSHPVSQVVIVDASAETGELLPSEFPGLRVRYLRHLPPSASRQRNVGVEAVDDGIELIGFVDDDAVLEADAVERMLDYWAQAPDDLGGASFNLMNSGPVGLQWLKRSRLCQALGLYRSEPGDVAPSGWQTLMGTVNQTRMVEWLATGAVVWRREVLRQFRFDEFFDGYSYLEDLDFSLTVGKHYKLAVVADARYHHYPAPGGRMRAYAFGKTEVRNRLYLVRKHDLSLWRCYLGLIIRMTMTLAVAVCRVDCKALQRALGNLVGLLQSCAPARLGRPKA